MSKCSQVLNGCKTTIYFSMFFQRLHNMLPHFEVIWIFCCLWNKKSSNESVLRRHCMINLWANPKVPDVALEHFDQVYLQTVLGTLAILDALITPTQVVVLKMKTFLSYSCYEFIATQTLFRTWPAKCVILTTCTFGLKVYHIYLVNWLLNSLCKLLSIARTRKLICQGLRLLFTKVRQTYFQEGNVPDVTFRTWKFPLLLKNARTCRYFKGKSAFLTSETINKHMKLNLASCLLIASEDKKQPLIQFNWNWVLSFNWIGSFEFWIMKAAPWNMFFHNFQHESLEFVQIVSFTSQWWKIEFKMLINSFNHRFDNLFHRCMTQTAISM